MKKKLYELVKSMRISSHTQGFTMIELLIVIAILGILAVAVLSAINPIEQINRGRDTGSRSDAEQLLSAIDRFNAFQGFYPWKVAATSTGLAVPWTDFSSSAALVDTASTPCPVSEKLSAAVVAGCTGTDELKVTYFTRIFDPSYNPLKIYNNGNPGDSTYVCFEPQSKAFITEAAARAAGTLPADYPAESLAAAGNCGTGNNCVCLP